MVFVFLPLSFYMNRIANLVVTKTTELKSIAGAEYSTNDD